MNIFYIAFKNIAHKPLSAALSLILLMTGSALAAFVLRAGENLERSFTSNLRGIDMVVGAKGSPLQLILSAVYHIDHPTGNITLAEANQLKENRLIKSATPLAYGDNYRGLRIVGSDTSFAGLYDLQPAEGTLHSKSMEVTLGWEAAKITGLRPGDTFVSAHGSEDDGEKHEEHPYLVTGIFKPTGNVADKLIITHLSSVWDVHRHEDEEEHEADHDEEHEHEHMHEHDKDHEHDEEHAHEEEGKEITAMLIKFRSPMGIMTLPRYVNTNTSMQAAVPAIEINRLLGLLDTGIKSLKAIAVVLMILSALSIFVSLWISLHDRKYELAIMRTLGASGIKIFSLLITEGAFAGFIGTTAGLLLSRAGYTWIAVYAETSLKLDMNTVKLTEAECWLPLIGAGIGIVASIVPALSAYRSNISKILASS